MPLQLHYGDGVLLEHLAAGHEFDWWSLVKSGYCRKHFRSCLGSKLASNLTDWSRDSSGNSIEADLANVQGLLDQAEKSGLPHNQIAEVRSRLNEIGHYCIQLIALRLLDERLEAAAISPSELSAAANLVTRLASLPALHLPSELVSVPNLKGLFAAKKVDSWLASARDSMSVLVGDLVRKRNKALRDVTSTIVDLTSRYEKLQTKTTITSSQPTPQSTPTNSAPERFNGPEKPSGQVPQRWTAEGPRHVHRDRMPVYGGQRRLVRRVVMLQGELWHELHAVLVVAETDNRFSVAVGLDARNYSGDLEANWRSREYLETGAITKFAALRHMLRAEIFVESLSAADALVDSLIQTPNKAVDFLARHAPQPINNVVSAVVAGKLDSEVYADRRHTQRNPFTFITLSHWGGARGFRVAPGKAMSNMALQCELRFDRDDQNRCLHAYASGGNEELLFVGQHLADSLSTAVSNGSKLPEEDALALKRFLTEAPLGIGTWGPYKALVKILEQQPWASDYLAISTTRLDAASNWISDTSDYWYLRNWLAMQKPSEATYMHMLRRINRELKWRRKHDPTSFVNFARALLTQYSTQTASRGANQVVLDTLLYGKSEDYDKLKYQAGEWRWAREIRDRHSKLHNPDLHEWITDEMLSEFTERLVTHSDIASWLWHVNTSRLGRSHRLPIKHCVGALLSSYLPIRAAAYRYALEDPSALAAVLVDAARLNGPATSKAVAALLDTADDGEAGKIVTSLVATQDSALIGACARWAVTHEKFSREVTKKVMTLILELSQSQEDPLELRRLFSDSATRQAFILAAFGAGLRLPREVLSDLTKDFTLADWIVIATRFDQLSGNTLQVDARNELRDAISPILAFEGQSKSQLRKALIELLLTAPSLVREAFVKRLVDSPLFGPTLKSRLRRLASSLGSAHTIQFYAATSLVVDDEHFMVFMRGLQQPIGMPIESFADAARKAKSLGDAYSYLHALWLIAGSSEDQASVAATALTSLTKWKLEVLTAAPRTLLLNPTGYAANVLLADSQTLRTNFEQNPSRAHDGARSANPDIAAIGAQVLMAWAVGPQDWLPLLELDSPMVTREVAVSVRNLTGPQLAEAVCLCLDSDVPTVRALGKELLVNVDEHDASEIYIRLSETHAPDVALALAAHLLETQDDSGQSVDKFDRRILLSIHTSRAAKRLIMQRRQNSLVQPSEHFKETLHILATSIVKSDRDWALRELVRLQSSGVETGLHLSRLGGSQ